MWKNILQFLGLISGCVIGALVWFHLQLPRPAKPGCGVYSATYDEQQFQLALFTAMLALAHGALGRVIGCRFDRVRQGTELEPPSETTSPFTSAAEWAKQTGASRSCIIAAIRNRQLEGFERDGTWYVARRLRIDER